MLFRSRIAQAAGQPVIIENRPGANGSIGTASAAKAAPDGHTFLIATSTTHAANASLYRKLPYDPIKDFTAITHVADVPNVLVVSPKLPVSSVKELVAYAKERPGKLNYASSGSGTIIHLNAELFRMLTGTDIVHVPYKGSALSIPDLASGNVAILFDSLASVMPHVKSGAVKPLALNAAKRSALLPNVPTLKEAGVPDIQANTWYGVYATAGTPPATLQKISAAMAQVMKDPDTIRRLADVGAVAGTMDPAQFDAFSRSEYARYGKLIAELGVKLD